MGGSHVRQVTRGDARHNSSVLDADRPDWRWLIIGPARSGSAFHVDPNQVSSALPRARARVCCWWPPVLLKSSASVSVG